MLSDAKHDGRDFRNFLLSYFPSSFELPFTSAHQALIEGVEKCVLEGGMRAKGVDRGIGTTTILTRAALYAALYGHRKFVLFVGRDKASAVNALDSMRAELERNPLLLQDFAGCSLRSRTASLVIRNAQGSTAIRAEGLTGQIRGLKALSRPDLCLIDNPQTAASARSASETAKRVAILSKHIRALGGGKPIAALMACTVIDEGDAADQILDRYRHPEWNGERTC